MKKMLLLFAFTALAASSANAVSFRPQGFTQYTVLSQTATVINLGYVSYTAGTGGQTLVCLSSNGGAAAGFKFQFLNTSITPATMISGSVGHYAAASTTAQCWGPFIAPVWLHVIGVAASSSVLVDVQKVP